MYSWIWCRVDFDVFCFGVLTYASGFWVWLYVDMFCSSWCIYVVLFVTLFVVCVFVCLFVLHLYCSAQLSMFIMEKSYRKKLLSLFIITIIVVVVVIVVAVIIIIIIIILAVVITIINIIIIIIIIIIVVVIIIIIVVVVVVIYCPGSAGVRADEQADRQARQAANSICSLAAGQKYWEARATFWTRKDQSIKQLIVWGNEEWSKKEADVPPSGARTVQLGQHWHCFEGNTNNDRTDRRESRFFFFFFFLQSPHCAANCLQHAHSSGQAQPCANHVQHIGRSSRATCRVARCTKGQLSC